MKKLNKKGNLVLAGVGLFMLTSVAIAELVFHYQAPPISQDQGQSSNPLTSSDHHLGGTP
jgi:hypothetical protein